MADGQVFERGVLREEFSRADLRTAPVNFEFPASIVEGQARDSAPVAANDKEASPQDAFEVKADGRDFKAGTPYRDDGPEQQRITLEKQNEHDRTIEALWEMVEARRAQEQAELDKLLASLTPEQIKEIGHDVSADYAKKAKAALERGDGAEAAHMQRLQSASDLYTQYLLQGYSPAAARRKLEQENGFNHQDVADIGQAFRDKVQTLGHEFGAQAHYSATVSADHAHSTSFGAALIGETEKMAPPVDSQFKQAVQFVEDQSAPSPITTTKQPVPGLDWK